MKNVNFQVKHLFNKGKVFLSQYCLIESIDINQLSFLTYICLFYINRPKLLDLVKKEEEEKNNHFI